MPPFPETGLSLVIIQRRSRDRDQPRAKWDETFSSQDAINNTECTRERVTVAEATMVTLAAILSGEKRAST